jgi:fructokinase
MNNPICIGSGFITLDILIKEYNNRTLSYYVGGSCGNVLMILSYLGWDVYPVARLSNDKNTERLISDFKKNHVNLDFVYKLQEGSTPVIIQRNITDKSGNPKHKFELKDPKTGKFLPRFKSITKMMANSILRDNINPNVFYFDRLTPGILTLANEYKERGALIIFEPSSIGDKQKFIEAIKIVDILKFSNQRIVNYKELYVDSVIPLEIETLGEKGIKYRCNFLDKKWHTLTAYKIENIIDSSGAGDWTTSGIIYYIEKKYTGQLNIMSKSDIEESLNFAQKLGALSCTFVGARGLMNLSKEEGFDTRYLTKIDDINIHLSSIL